MIHDDIRDTIRDAWFVRLQRLPDEAAGGGAQLVAALAARTRRRGQASANE